MIIHADRIQVAINPAMMATDLADYLVALGIPFREAHTLTGQAVRTAEKLGVDLKNLPLSEFQAIHPSLDDTVYQVFDPKQSITRRNATGGTAPKAVLRQLDHAKEVILWESISSEKPRITET